MNVLQLAFWLVIVSSAALTYVSIGSTQDTVEHLTSVYQKSQPSQRQGRELAREGNPTLAECRAHFRWLARYYDLESLTYSVEYLSEMSFEELLDSKIIIGDCMIRRFNLTAGELRMAYFASDAIGREVDHRILEQQEGDYKRVVEKYNALAQEFNGLAEQHQSLVNDYNKVVHTSRASVTALQNQVAQLRSELRTELAARRVFDALQALTAYRSLKAPVYVPRTSLHCTSRRVHDYVYTDCY